MSLGKVVLVYERKNRELETAIVLQKMLVDVGFDCSVTQFYKGCDFNIFGRSPDILIVPHLYNDLSVARLIARYGRPKAIINLQYEQVLSDKWEKLGHHNPSGIAMNASHICWGKTTFERLSEFGVPSQNLLMIGAPHLDVLSQVDDKFCDAYKRRLALKFEMDESKEWVLFLSSFTYADISEHRLRMNESVAGSNLREFVKIHSRSRGQILDWFKDALSLNPDKLFIYRPHPDELSLEKVYSLAKEFDNFRVISFGAAKQWIMASDSIFSWYSTTVVESHYMKKKYQILRPVRLPDYFDSVLLKKATFITEKTDFLECLNSEGEDQPFPLKHDDIARYYENIDGSIASEKIVQYACQVVESKKRQCFKVPLKSLLRAKFISLSVLVVFSLYCLTRRVPATGFIRKIGFFDRWFSEFDNQFVERWEVSDVSDSINSFNGGVSP
jgi:surface carbohydrate biosynthesis protein